MAIPIVTQIKIPPLDWPIAYTKVIKYRSDHWGDYEKKKATHVPSTIIEAKKWHVGTVVEQHLVKLNAGHGVLVKESKAGEIIRSFANGSHLMSFEREVAQSAKIDENTELGWYNVDEGIILQPRERRWSIRI